MDDLTELAAKLVDEASKALHRKGVDPTSCSCPRRRHNFDYRLGRIEEATSKDGAERSMTPYVAVACPDCGSTRFYLLPILIGVETFNKIAADHLGRIL
jgi:hypothetical protein